MATPPKVYLTAKDVAEALQVCRVTIWRLVKRGELRPSRLFTGAPRRPGAKARPRIRFDPSEVERYMQRCARRAVP